MAVVPAGRRKGVWKGRRTALVRKPSAYAEPPCPQFGTCGGCLLQELELSAQRAHKQALALRQIRGAAGDRDVLEGARVHPVRGAPAAYGYRNRVELSFGVQRWVDEAAKAEGAALDGRFLGFHAPGRFDRIVDTPRCWLASDAMNEVIRLVREHALRGDAPPPYDPRDHQGFWRHLLVREAADGVLAVIYAAPPEGPSQGAERAVERVAEALAGAVKGLQWRVNSGVADVARGEVAREWGEPWLEEALGDLRLRIGPEAFLQTNTEGCVVLYDTVAEALAPTVGAAAGAGLRGTLVDLYCGAGAIGLYLADRFDRVVGLEEREEAVRDARENAARNQVPATFRVAKVEEALEDLGALLDRADGPLHLVVDPPRAGLHPKVARRLAEARVASLVYVACHPASLGRDAAILAAGGWRLTDVFTVDLFPQTGHIEMVGRFAHG